MQTHFMRFALAAFFLACYTESIASAEQPNFIVIVSDDQSYEAIGALSKDNLQTPNLDRLAQRGVSFTHAYNMGAWNGAVCIASRAMLISGRSVWHAENLMSAGRPKKAKTVSASSRGKPLFWPELMERAGYQTFMAGKWHIDKLADAREIFQTTRNIRPGMPKTLPEAYDRPSQANTWSPSDEALGGHWEGGKHWSEVLAGDGISFLEQSHQSDKPFFMYLAFNSPHDPRQSPQNFVDMYPRDTIKVPADFLPEYPYKQEMGCYEVGTKQTPKLLRDEKLAPWPRTPEAVRLHRQEYYAIISHMDEQVGRILQALDESKHADNTYVIFTSDHGLACGHHGLLGKQNMYDHSMRVPLILVGPDFPPGQQFDTNVYLQDIMPTTLELAGIEVPTDVEFQSLFGFCSDGDLPKDRDIYGCYRADHQRMVRDERYKLIVYPQVPIFRLFDVKNDPAEMHDLAHDKDFRDVAKRMFRKLLDLQKEMDDPLVLTAEVFGL